MAIEQIDDKFWKGETFNFQDLGPARKGGRTNKYKVTSRRRRDNGAHLGFIRWANAPNCMSFYPVVMLLSPSDMIEIAAFCTSRTQTHLLTTDYHLGVTRARKRKA